MIRILKTLFRLMSQYKGRLYLGIALSMISNILGIVPIICGVWTIKLILDDSNGAASWNRYMFSNSPQSSLVQFCSDGCSPISGQPGRIALLMR